jgi:uncharacterized protein YabN with tetrapyrrole methylase and pyrophosphatase domain
MSVPPQYPYDIAVVGLGISGVHQITREAEETMRRCNEIFVADQAPGILRYLSSLGPQVTDLATRLTPGVHRLVAYRAMASEIIAGALERAPVCFATYGHPKMYSYPTILIQRAAAILDLRVKILPGISFLDTLLVDLGVDPGLDGLQLYEATDLLVRRRPLQTDVACVIAQAPVAVEPRQWPSGQNLPNLTLLQTYLQRFYPADHQVVIVISKTHPLLEPILQRTRIGTLAAALGNTSHSGTLYIPPVERRPVADTQMADRMREVPDGSRSR